MSQNLGKFGKAEVALWANVCNFWDVSRRLNVKADLFQVVVLSLLQRTVEGNEGETG